MKKQPILKVDQLSLSFSQYTKGLQRQDLKVIKDLNIELYEGEILAVVGASGSGKSLLASAVLGLLPAHAKQEGRIYYSGSLLGSKEKAKLRGKEIALIPQSVNYLDPLQKVGKQIALSLKDKKKVKGTITALFKQYGLEPEVAEYYPFQLSGGMARKVLLATALVSHAKVIIADEPTPGLDDGSLQEVLKDFRSLADRGCGILMITHDIEAALKIADRVAIFYGGTTLEIANVEDFHGDGSLLRHPYTKALNEARPGRGFTPARGSQPFPDSVINGCLFFDRCEMSEKECQKEMPVFRAVREGKVRCLYAT